MNFLTNVKRYAYTNYCVKLEVSIEYYGKGEERVLNIDEKKHKKRWKGDELYKFGIFG